MKDLTQHQHINIITQCKDIFTKKNEDYGPSWRILRLPSITDQIFIKAQRIRTLQENGFSKVDEGQNPEFIGIVNYCVMALIQIQLINNPHNEAYLYDFLYDQMIEETVELLIK